MDPNLIPRASLSVPCQADRLDLLLHHLDAGRKNVSPNPIPSNPAFPAQDARLAIALYDLVRKTNIATGYEIGDIEGFLMGAFTQRSDFPFVVHELRGRELWVPSDGRERPIRKLVAIAETAHAIVEEMASEDLLHTTPANLLHFATPCVPDVTLLLPQDILCANRLVASELGQPTVFLIDQFHDEEVALLIATAHEEAHRAVTKKFGVSRPSSIDLHEGLAVTVEILTTQLTDGGPALPVHFSWGARLRLPTFSSSGVVKATEIFRSRAAPDAMNEASYLFGFAIACELLARDKKNGFSKLMTALEVVNSVARDVDGEPERRTINERSIRVAHVAHDQTVPLDFWQKVDERFRLLVNQVASLPGPDQFRVLSSHLRSLITAERFPITQWYSAALALQR